MFKIQEDRDRSSITNIITRKPLRLHDRSSITCIITRKPLRLHDWSSITNIITWKPLHLHDQSSITNIITRKQLRLQTDDDGHTHNIIRPRFFLRSNEKRNMSFHKH